MTGTTCYMFYDVITKCYCARLDDPLDAVAVHGGGGVVGLLAVPFFMSVNLEVGSGNDSCCNDVTKLPLLLIMAGGAERRILGR